MHLISTIKKASRRAYIKAQRGFTLIELLVVISIIALLSSIVLASLNSARNKAKRAAILENGHSMLLELALCINDGGEAQNFPNAQVGGNPAHIMCTAPNHTMVWPKLPPGWVYGTSPGTTLAGGDYTFNFVSPGQVDIYCSIVTNTCN